MFKMSGVKRREVRYSERSPILDTSSLMDKVEIKREPVQSVKTLPQLPQMNKTNIVNDPPRTISLIVEKLQQDKDKERELLGQRELLKGGKGDRGERGDTGLQGERGATGLQGKSMLGICIPEIKIDEQITSLGNLNYNGEKYILESLSISGSLNTDYNLILSKIGTGEIVFQREIPGVGLIVVEFDNFENLPYCLCGLNLRLEAPNMEKNSDMIYSVLYTLSHK